MRRVARWLGGSLLVLGAAAAVAQILALVAGIGTSRVSLGEVWFAVHANSLVGVQASTERGLGELAVGILITLLGLPAWLPVGALGLAFWLLGRERRRAFD